MISNEQTLVANGSDPTFQVHRRGPITPTASGSSTRAPPCADTRTGNGRPLHSPAPSRREPGGSPGPGRRRRLLCSPPARAISRWNFEPSFASCGRAAATFGSCSPAAAPTATSSPATRTVVKQLWVAAILPAARRPGRTRATPPSTSPGRMRPTWRCAATGRSTRARATGRDARAAPTAAAASAIRAGSAPRRAAAARRTATSATPPPTAATPAPGSDLHQPRPAPSRRRRRAPAGPAKRRASRCTGERLRRPERPALHARSRRRTRNDDCVTRNEGLHRRRRR